MDKSASKIEKAGPKGLSLQGYQLLHQVRSEFVRNSGYLRNNIHPVGLTHHTLADSRDTRPSRNVVLKSLEPSPFRSHFNYQRHNSVQEPALKDSKTMPAKAHCSIVRFVDEEVSSLRQSIANKFPNSRVSNYVQTCKSRLQLRHQNRTTDRQETVLPVLDSSHDRNIPLTQAHTHTETQVGTPDLPRFKRVSTAKKVRIRQNMEMERRALNKAPRRLKPSPGKGEGSGS